MLKSVVLLTLLCLTASLPARADEGMWPVNAFPSDKVEKAYGFKPDQKWLDHVRLSAVRLAGGCSASFVSPRGLVQTNHHCAHECIEQLSTAAKDYVASGFLAKEEKDEVKCPKIEVNQLIRIQDVTARVRGAVAGKSGTAFAEALRGIKATIAKECSKKNDSLRCDVVELYHGGLYDLYKYRRYQDVRLVFAPEFAIAFFGGDPDNFEFPRHDLDVSYLRVYEDGEPLDTSKTYFPYAQADAKPGDLTFTVGHPGKTDRQGTVAQMEFDRDIALPRTLFYLSELRGQLTDFATKGPEQARISGDLLFGVENSFKGLKGKWQSIVDPAILKQRAAAEKALQRKVKGPAWETIRTTLAKFKDKYDRFAFTEGPDGLTSFRKSQLFLFARTIVRHAEEVTKPDDKRLEEYTDANFPILRQTLTANRPIYPELEKLTLAYSLTKLREALGPDDRLVKKVLGGKSPAMLAAELVDKTSLGNVDVRRNLLNEDQAAIEDSSDPMIVLARAIDPDLRRIRRDYEETVEPPITKSYGEIAAAMFKLYGTSVYPDATFTLRVSYGSVKGYMEKGKPVAPVTTIGGAFERATGAEPFKLPDSWLAAKSSLNLQQPMNFATTNDIIGGNSGSPVINKEGQVVGLIFDGNIESLGGDYGYDGGINRAVAVSVGALREALAKVYHADRLVNELKP